jgi:pimeloyl-ACP methyl ester carboxylesterase
VSTPRFLDLPSCAQPIRLDTARGQFAAHIATPSGEILTTALLVPGYCGSKEDFIALLEPLALRGVRVVAIDPRGQYETIGPDEDAAYKAAAQGADVVALIEAIGSGPVHLLGHSFGGLITREATIARPELVRSLTLLCTGPAAVSGTAADRVKLQVAALEQYDLGTVQALRESFAAAQGEEVPAAPIRDFLRHRFTSNNRLGLIAVSRELLSAADRTPNLRDTGRPVLVAFGERDDAWPLEEQRDMALRLDAELAVIPGTGHSPAVDDPRATSELLAGFWFGTDATRS